ncbi:MAG: GNAT family N-acetyltransferase [Gemmobacter sp.]|jgi:putative hemolysin|nr:GNAT family N-acetyltransferase [Gemmobacter sp.]
MEPLRTGRHIARLAVTPGDVAAAQALRHLCFFGKAGCDADDLDPLCLHVLVEEVATGLPVCCYRLLSTDGAGLEASYAAGFYDLSRLRGFPGPMLELGRFCIRPGPPDPDILRLAWAAMTRIVDAEGVAMIFGCASFASCDPELHRAAFARLAAAHLAPECWRPGRRAPEVVALCSAKAPPDAQAAMPPLLRTYLAMGGWVSDHAVVDRRMNTLHVFTAVEVAAIPPARVRALRLLAQ